jgi:hypothetical protein
MKEIWRDIEGYEGLYQVSNLGRVKSLGNGGSNSKERIRKLSKEKCGYLFVALSKNGIKKQYKVHRLVASAFIPNHNNLPYVNHKDECKTNNACSNLEWCDAKYNINYGTAIERRVQKQKNNNRSKSVLCIDTGIIYPSISEAQRQTGFSEKGISLCCRKLQDKCGGFHWIYT